MSSRSQWAEPPESENELDELRSRFREERIRTDQLKQEVRELNDKIKEIAKAGKNLLEARENLFKAQDELIQAHENMFGSLAVLILLEDEMLDQFFLKVKEEASPELIHALDKLTLVIRTEERKNRIEQLTSMSSG